MRYLLAALTFIAALVLGVLYVEGRRQEDLLELGNWPPETNEDVTFA